MRHLIWCPYMRNANHDPGSTFDSSQSIYLFMHRSCSRLLALYQVLGSGGELYRMNVNVRMKYKLIPRGSHYDINCPSSAICSYV